MFLFLRVKGAYTNRSQMPGEFLFGDSYFCVGLSQEGAYTSRCQMPDRMFDGVNDYIGDGLYLGDHTKSLGSSD